jgi:drug/metabolite transporter (DMT)-like permease
MIAIILAIFASTCLNLLLKFTSKHYVYSIPFILLVVEISKLFISLGGMLWISRQRKNCPVRFGFIVNSFLYAIVNYLTHIITQTMPVSIYSVLINHKIVWVVLFSILILKKSFSMQQYVALILVCSGCMLTKMTVNSGQVSAGSTYVLILFQGICSSLSSVWIEKMMKITERPIVSENPSNNKFYWFLFDSFQMYLFAIPIYIVGAYTAHNTSKTTLPMELFVMIISLSILNGMSLGAVFVYHSSIVRSIIAAVVIIVLAIDHGIFTIYIVSGVVLVLVGSIVWSIGPSQNKMPGQV